jgi:hypothetical protein
MSGIVVVVVSEVLITRKTMDDGWAGKKKKKKRLSHTINENPLFALLQLCCNKTKNSLGNCSVFGHSRAA